MIHPSGTRSSRVRGQAWHHLTPQLAQHCLEQLLIRVQRIIAAAQVRQAMVYVTHSIAPCDNGQVAWLSSSSIAAVAGNIVEAGEAGHLLDCAGAGACGVHGSLELCEGGVHEGWQWWRGSCCGVMAVGGETSCSLGDGTSERFLLADDSAQDPIFLL